MKIKGHTTIILKDVKTGKVERHEDNNMMTNALTNYFANCGFMNYPNLDKNNMVELLLGGVLAFDDEIPENVNTVYAPAGLKMIANGSVGVVNNSEVLEMGSYSTTESGWQSDGSYVQTYDYTTSQANGTIACVCLTSKDYGYVGEGNSISQVAHSTKRDITGLMGSQTLYSGFTGWTIKVDIVNAILYTFNIESRIDSQTEESYKTGVLRQYRIPTTKISIKGKVTEPVLLSEEDVQIDSDMANASLADINGNGKLYLYNTSQVSEGVIPDWGDGFTQYLWTVNTSGTITKQTVINTTGDTLKCLGLCYFDGNYGIFAKTLSTSATQVAIDPRVLYAWNLTTGTMERINNPMPQDIYRPQTEEGKINWQSNSYYGGLLLIHGSGNGRLLCMGAYSVVIDAVTKTAYPTNGMGNTPYYMTFHTKTTSPLIVGNGVYLYRDSTYIASINNLDTPVVKTAEKTMKIIYRLIFEEEENE